MRIEKHMGSLLAQRLEASKHEQAKLLEKMATGKKINRASDDAAGLAIAGEFEKQIRGFRNASQNIEAGMSALAIADGNASSITDMLQRQRELAMQGANGTYNADQRESLNREFHSLSDEIARVSQGAGFNGMNLLDGTGKLADGTGKLQVGPGAGPGDQISLPGADLTLASLDMDEVTLDSQDASFNALSAIDSAMAKVNSTRATQGGVVNRLEDALAHVQNQVVNTTKSLSAVEDLDFAKALTDKVRTEILGSTGLASLSQFNQISRSHLLALLQ